MSPEKRAEKKLQRALEENLERALKSVPDEQEIEQMHTFSKSFEQQVRRIAGKKRKRISFITLRQGGLIAAGICGIILLSRSSLFQGSESGSDMSSRDDTAAADIADVDDDDGTEIMMSESEVEEEKADSRADNPEGEAAVLHTVDGAVELTLDKDVYQSDELLELEIHRISGRISYGNAYQIEQYTKTEWSPIDGAIAFTEEQKEFYGEGSERVTIDLGAYDITEGGRYRIVKEINGEQISVEFEVE